MDGDGAGVPDSLPNAIAAAGDGGAAAAEGLAALSCERKRGIAMRNCARVGLGGGAGTEGERRGEEACGGRRRRGFGRRYFIGFPRERGGVGWSGTVVDGCACGVEGGGPSAWSTWWSPGGLGAPGGSFYALRFVL